jgi:3-oxoacyl-[acyl-carrier-protein] synthase-1
VQTAIGLSLSSSSSAFRSGIPGFGRCEYLRRRKNGHAITLALIPTLPPDDFALERMKALGLEAAREALSHSLDRLARHRECATGLPVFLSVPPPRPGLPEGSGKPLAQEIMSSLPIGIDRERSLLMETGHDGGLAVLGMAAAFLAAGLGPAFLVGGVESYKDIEMLHWLEELGRLKTAETPNGFVPGEAAGFLLVGTRRFASEIGARPLAEIAASARATEPSPWYMGEPIQGQGLTDALRGALDPRGDGGSAVAMVYADLNGESWRVDEWGYAYLRNAQNIQDPLDIKHPADCWGDIGAASGAVLAALGAHELAHPRNSAPTALVWAACDTRPFRSACVIHRYEEVG